MTFVIVETPQALLIFSISRRKRSPETASPRLWTEKGTLRLMITDLATLTLTSNGHHLPTTLPIPGPPPSQTLPFVLFHRLLSAWRAYRSSLSLYIIFQLYFETQARPPSNRMYPTDPLFRFRRWYLLLFLWIIDHIVCLKIGRWCCYKNLKVFMTPKNALWGFTLLYRTLQEKKRSRIWFF